MAIPGAISEYLARNGVHYEVIQHRTAYTARDGAAVSHVPGREWAKAVVCIADDRPVLAVVPANYAVDVGHLRQCLGAASLRLATEDEFAPFYRDCEVGAMPPFGPLYGQQAFVEKSLTSDPEIVFNAGSHREAIRMRYDDFAALVHPTVGDFGIPARTM